MGIPNSQAGRKFQARLLFSTGMALVLALFAGSLAMGQQVTKVEEDWELVVSLPDPDTFAPQVTTTFSPVGNLDSIYAVFDLNLKNFPSYEAGGVQLQLWSGDQVLGSKRQNTGTLLRVENETLTWTHRLRISDGQLVLEVVNGKSQTWGAFGGLSFASETELANLNEYNRSVSLTNAGIGYASNRVTSLTMKALRAYAGDELLGEDTDPKVVFPRQSAE